MFDLKANNVLSLMGTTACKGVQSGCGFFPVVVNSCSCANTNWFVIPALPLVAAVAVETEAFLSWEISAACVEFSAPLAG